MPDAHVSSPGALTTFDPAIEQRLGRAGRGVRWAASAYATLVAVSAATGILSSWLLADDLTTVGRIRTLDAVALATLCIGSLLAGGRRATEGATTTVRRVGVALGLVASAYGVWVVVVALVGEQGWISVGRMPAFSGGLALSALGLAIPLTASRRERRVVTAQITCALVFSLMGVIVVAYVYGDPSLGSLVAGPALPLQAAIIGLGASVGILLLRPGSGILAVASSPGAGGTILRRFGPLAVAAPTLLLLLVEIQPLSDRIDMLAIVAVGLGLALLTLLALVVRVIDDQAVEAATAAAAAQRAASALGQRAPVVAGVSEALHVVHVEESGVWEVETRYRPAAGAVTGDASGVRVLPDGTINVVLVDVTGHGAEPAVKAVRIRDTVLASLVAGRPPAEALGIVGAAFPEIGTLASAIALVADGTGAGEIASAGHPPPIFSSTQRAELLPPTGPLLFLDPGYAYTGQPRTFEVGDEMAFYSDGIADVQVEDEDGRNEVEVLADLLLSEGGDAARTADLVLGFADPEPQDDQSVVVIRRVG